MKSLELAEAAKLRQILALQETVASSSTDPAIFLERSCQAIAHLLGKPAAGLLRTAERPAQIVAFYGSAARRDTIRAWLETGLSAGSHLAHPTTVMLDLASDAPAQLLLLPFCPGKIMAVLEPTRRQFSADELWSAHCLTSLLGAGFRHLERQHQLAASGQEALEAIVAMAHDLRSPLNVILGYANLLAEEAYGPLEAKQKEILSTVAAKGELVLSLLTGAMDLARLEVHGDAGTASEVSLHAVIEDLASSAAARASGSGVTVECSVGANVPRLKIEKAYLQHVLQNLIDNALGATANGKVQIRAVYEEARRAVRLTVTDTGNGIEPSRIPHLFQLFHDRGDAPASRPGHGCGLFLVRKFCEKLGAKLEVSSKLGEGSSFSVLVPADAAPEKPGYTEAREAS